MKYKLLVICLFFAFSTMVSANSLPLFGKTIYIDPGHGGFDPGATYKEVNEAEINLQIANRLKDTLEKEGATVLLTRSGDYDLSKPYALNHKRNDLTERSNIINESNANMFISIHLNADSSGTWSGAQVFYDNINSENIKIATIIQESLKENLNTSKEAKELEETFLYSKLKIRGVLVEVGYITNYSERNLLQTNNYQNKVAKAIKKGIINYFNMSN